VKIELTVNGERKILEVEPGEYLLDTLRNRLGYTGTKENCRQGECGACTVILDGESVNSCLILTAAVSGSTVETIEGLSRGGKLHPVQEAFMVYDASQCGYCTPGMVMSAKALLDRNPHPTEREIKKGLEGNLCRCTGYKNIITAVGKAARAMQKENTDHE